MYRDGESGKLSTSPTSNVVSKWLSQYLNSQMSSSKICTGLERWWETKEKKSGRIEREVGERKMMIDRDLSTMSISAFSLWEKCSSLNPEYYYAHLCFMDPRKTAKSLEKTQSRGEKIFMMERWICRRNVIEARQGMKDRDENAFSLVHLLCVGFVLAFTCYLTESSRVPPLLPPFNIRRQGFRMLINLSET